MSAPKRTPGSPEQEALSAFKNSDYDKVTRLLESVRAAREPSRRLIRLGFLSYLRLGRPEEALKLYPSLVPALQPDDSGLLRQLALSFITSRVRDPQEHVRIAAYTALAEIGDPETAPVLEDGLLDSSVLVRARAAEAIGKAGLAATSGALKRALHDDIPAVRIAALNAFAETKAPGVREEFTRRARRD